MFHRFKGHRKGIFDQKGADGRIEESLACCLLQLKDAKGKSRRDFSRLQIIRAGKHISYKTLFFDWCISKIFI